MISVLESLTEGVSWLTLTLAVFCPVLIYIYFRRCASAKGPWGWPYLGYYPYLKEEFHLQLGELAKKYGDVFCFRVTGQWYVHLNTLSAVRDAHLMKSECFEKRTENYSILKDMYHDGIGFTNGEPWKVLRKFFVQTLKEFGMGKQTQENFAVDRVHNVLHVLKTDGEKGVDAFDLFIGNCNHVIHQLLFSGEKIGDDDVMRLQDTYKKMLHFAKGPKLLLAGPVAKHFIFPYMKEFRGFTESKEEMKSLLHKIIRQHEDSFDKDNLRDIVDYFINERRTLQEKGDPKADIFTDSALIYSLILIYGDGSLSVGWLVGDTIRELAKYPDVQKKIQSEIDEVVGRQRLPNWSDRHQLKYLTATFYEIQRTTAFLPVVPSLECTKETTVLGQRIPKGAITLMNVWSIHHDPELYEDPFKFEPNRFMSTRYKNARAELPLIFGIGKRACAGEPLTNMQLLLFVAAVLQNFDLHPLQEDSPGVEEVKEDWTMMIKATPRTA